MSDSFIYTLAAIFCLFACIVLGWPTFFGPSFCRLDLLKIVAIVATLWFAGRAWKTGHSNNP